MHVKLIDPSAFTPPYDRALAAALAAEGAEVELITSDFTYGPVPETKNYEVSLDFYRHLSPRARRLSKASRHIPEMRQLRNKLEAVPGPMITHYQWLTMPGIDLHLLSSRRPRVMTAHYILPQNPSRRQINRAKETFAPMDAVIAHSVLGARRLVDEVGLEREQVQVIPHGAFDYLTSLPVEKPLPPELREPSPVWEETGTPRPPVILFFGLLRPYKGIDVLLDAARELAATDQGTTPEIWIVGNPRMDLAELKERAASLEVEVRWLARFIEDAEIPEIMRQADVLVLPYLDGEQSGVLYTGLAFGKAMVVSEVGGIGEVARAHGAARLVPPGDAAALGHELAALTRGEGAAEAREELAARCRAAAEGPFAWRRIARQTLDLYEGLLS
ncbi:MAG TPA: glycosyltransferase family 4 protein [Solirubrobacterales bacterium]|mgnify:CR=1 FL=1|nr:glycosyltransferase family 4 protein [Solirubrobacterales bacterium]